MIPENRFRVSQVLLLALGHFAVDLYSGFLPPLIPTLQKAVGFSITQAAFLITVFSLSMNLFQSLAGYVFDRWKDARLMVVAPLLTGVCMSCLGVIPSYSGLVVLLVLGGISIAVFHPQGAALAALASGPRHSVGMSIFVTGGTVGVATGSLLASVLVEAAGLRGPLYAIALGGVASFGMWRRVQHSATFCLETSVEVKGGVEPGGSGRLIGWSLLAMTRAFIVLGCLTFVPLYLSQQGRSLSTIGFTLFVFGLAGGLGGLTAGQWAERLGEKRVLLTSFLIPGPLLGVYILLGSSLAGIACFGLAGYWLYSGVPLLLSISQRSFPGQVGMISSLVMGVSWGLAGLAMTPAGMLAERVGLVYTLWGLSLTALIGFFLAFAILQSFPLGLPSPSSPSPENAEEKRLTSASS